MVRPHTRLASACRYAERSLLWRRYRMLDRPVQLLWLERDEVRERDCAEPDGYVQDARDLDRQLVAGLGDAHVADLALAGGRVRPAGLWHSAWLGSQLPCQLTNFCFPRPPSFLVLVQQPRTATAVPACIGFGRRRGRVGGCTTPVGRRVGRDGAPACRPWHQWI